VEHEFVGDAWSRHMFQGEYLEGGVLDAYVFPEFPLDGTLVVTLILETLDKDPVEVVPFVTDDTEVMVTRAEVIAEWGETESEFDEH
jgi:hypothetical protein